ncbi:YceD family protein [Xylocopilactobacillus apicola]|uniref:DUF177 domain-containing protein n=1 Tax=Xylocopilactobacillus apicola TaxID=2932184 RepID=A0AAU9DEK7_9LACO|nr:DUF177 domain-containing protein [Xylocopilactobacillus apicola]BDR58320.1 hypothetical protein XA3_07610 [Xylocopilactobacillus apicola]
MKLVFDFAKVLERKSPTIIETEVDLGQEIEKRKPDYQACDPFMVKIKLLPIDGKYVEAHFELEGKLIVPSTRSLLPAKVKIFQNADEIFKFPEIELEDGEKEEQVITDVENNVLDLYNTVVDYILLAVPTQVLTEEEQKENLMPKGTNWQVISEADFKSPTDKSESLPAQTRNQLEKLKKELDQEKND